MDAYVIHWNSKMSCKQHCLCRSCVYCWLAVNANGIIVGIVCVDAFLSKSILGGQVYRARTCAISTIDRPIE